MKIKHILLSIIFVAAVFSLQAQTFVKLDFNNNDITAPLYKYWATPPCYIERMEDKYMEFYYNQAAFDANQVRNRKGAELRWDYKSYTEAWYGFKFFLPEGKFPKDAIETHIAQIFQFGSCNSWAGMLSIEKQDLRVAHRSSCGTPTKGLVKANIPWNTWITVVMHFKVSKNKTGMFQVWINDDPKESPTYNAQNINFGFGEWDDDTTLAEGNDIGGKWGMYCWEGGDRTIRFDDLAVLVGYDANGFEKVNPESKFPVITNRTVLDCSIGTEFIMPITATNNPTTYNAIGLPAWLKIDKETGIISGTPTTAGRYDFLIYASNEAGTDVAAIQLKVGTDLVIYYPFDGSAYDSSDYSRHPSLSGNISYVDGKFEKAITLNGENTYLKLPPNIFNTLDDVTIMTWVKITELRTWSRIFDFGTDTNSYMFLTPKAGSGYPRFSIKKGGSEQYIEADKTLSVNEWAHVAVTLENNTGKLYIDGVLTATNPDITIKPSGLGITPNNHIGRSQYTADPYFKGSIDEFRIYRKALSADDIISFSKNPLSIGNVFKKKDIASYPNPVTDYLTLELPDNIRPVTYQLSNLNGTVMQSRNLAEQENKIDLRGVLSGIYVLTLTCQDNSTIIKKIIKK